MKNPRYMFCREFIP